MIEHQAQIIVGQLITWTEVETEIATEIVIEIREEIMTEGRETANVVMTRIGGHHPAIEKKMMVLFQNYTPSTRER